MPINQYNNKKDGAAIVGNSLSFGEGQSCDEKTISSVLSSQTKYNFYNFSGRGFSGFQEIVNFLVFKNKVKNLKKIIVISGLNDSILPFFVKKYNSYLTPTFGYEKFSKVMNNASRGWKNTMIKFFLNKFLKKNDEFWLRVNSLNWKDEINHKNDMIEMEDTRNTEEKMQEIFTRNINIWSSLAKGMNVDIDYILQPVGSWCKSIQTNEEKKIFFEEDEIPALKKVYKHVEKDKYEKVKKILKDCLKKESINFIDINEDFNKIEYSDKWLFTSKFHLTDLGSQITSENIINKMKL